MSQKKIVLMLLRERGPAGVSSHELIYRYGITRGAAVVHVLRHEDGFDIETRDEGETPDGKQRLARYILKNGGRKSPAPPPDEPFELPPPSKLPLPCGCVRSADGRGWEYRCEGHVV
jgi:hypothetical protein